MASQPENITFSFPKSAIPGMIGAGIVSVILLALVLTRLLDDEIDAQIDYRPGLRWNMTMDKAFEMETANGSVPFRYYDRMGYNHLYFGPYQYFGAECVTRYRFLGNKLIEFAFTFRFDTLEEAQAMAERIGVELSEKYYAYIYKSSLRSPPSNPYGRLYILPNTHIHLLFLNYASKDGFFFIEVLFSPD